VSRDPDHAPFRDDVSRLGLATINLQTKFEVSNYTHYEDMRSGAKCTNWGSLGQLGITQSHPQCHHSIERIRLLFDFNRSHASILYLFLDIASYLSKFADFNRPRLHLAPRHHGRILRRSLASEKLESLSYRVVLFV